MSDTPILWEETFRRGATWPHVLKRGAALRIADLLAGSFFRNFGRPVERCNLPGTLVYAAQRLVRFRQEV